MRDGRGERVAGEREGTRREREMLGRRKMDVGNDEAVEERETHRAREALTANEKMRGREKMRCKERKT